MNKTKRVFPTENGLQNKLLRMEPLAPLDDATLLTLMPYGDIPLETLRTLEAGIRELLQAQLIRTAKRAPAPWHELSDEAMERLSNGEATADDQMKKKSDRDYAI